MSGPATGQTWTHPAAGDLTLTGRAYSSTAFGPALPGWDYVTAGGRTGWVPECWLTDGGFVCKASE